MARKDRMDAAGAVGLVGFALLLGFNQVVIKVVNDGLQPVFWAGARSGLAALCLWLWFAWRRQVPQPGAGLWGPRLLMGTAFAVEFVLLFVALDLTSVARTSVIFYSMPIWLTLAAHFLLPGERITRVKALGLALAVSGVAWAILDREGGGGEGSLAGDLCALGAAFAWASLPLLARLTPAARESGEMQMFWQVLISAPILLALSLAFGPWLRDPGPLHVGGLIFQAVVIVSLGFVFWFRLIAIYPTNSVASFSFLTPVFGVFFGWALLDEEIGPVILGALGLVAVGIVLINRPVRRAVPGG